MANWYGTSRSNYFKVKDEAAFRATAEKLGLQVLETTGGDRFGVAAGDNDDGAWPSVRWAEDSESGVDEDIWVPDEFAPHLQDEEVAIFVSAGAEKLRYVTGEAVAINNKGEQRTVFISDIYELAKELGENEITVAEY